MKATRVLQGVFSHSTLIASCTQVQYAAALYTRLRKGKETCHQDPELTIFTKKYTITQYKRRSEQTAAWVYFALLAYSLTLHSGAKGYRPARS